MKTSKIDDFVTKKHIKNHGIVVKDDIINNTKHLNIRN